MLDFTQQSPLLQLPGELRNLIYECTLAMADGAFCKRRCGSGPFRLYESSTCDPIDRNEINQMKYSCHQLYRETSGLGLEMNTIIFDSASTFLTFPQPLASRDCCSFMRECAETQQRKIKKITLWEVRPDDERFPHEDPGFDLNSVSLLIQYCKYRPDIEIALRIGRLDVTASPFQFVIDAFMTHITLRKDDTKFSFSIPANALNKVIGGAMFMAEFWEGYGTSTEAAPANFKVFPWHGYSETLNQALSITHLRGFEDGWKDQVKFWYERGI